jgi:biotin transport system substrate-specific component
MKTKNLVLAALMAGIMSCLSQISIPIGPVPITLAVWGVFLTAGLLGGRGAALSLLVYLLLGAAGLPVFANLKGGWPALAGPTGGYLFGYVIAGYLTGALFEKTVTRFGERSLYFFCCTVFGLAFIYLIGMVQLKYVLNLTWAHAFNVGVKPFLAFDLVKGVLASLVVIPIRRTLQASGLLSS